jgi:hypothetical protein
VITPETELMMSNLQHGCCTKRGLAMDGLSTLVTFISLTTVKIQCDPWGAVGFQRVDGGIHPLIAASNLALTSNRGFLNPETHSKAPFIIAVKLHQHIKSCAFRASKLNAYERTLRLQFNEREVKRTYKQTCKKIKYR